MAFRFSGRLRVMMPIPIFHLPFNELALHNNSSLFFESKGSEGEKSCLNVYFFRSSRTTLESLTPRPYFFKPAQFSNVADDPAGKFWPIGFPIGVQRPANFYLHLGPKFPGIISNSHGDKGDPFPPFPAHFLLNAQDTLDETMFSPAHGVGVIGPFRKKNDELSLF